MRILVTGGAGFIGTHLIRFLLDQADVSVLNVDKLTYASHPDALADWVHRENYTFEQIDLLDGADLMRVLNEYKPDAIMHLAAESHVDRSIEDADCFVGSNIIGTFRLLEATLDFWNAHSRPSSFRFLHVSTDEVYGSLDADAPKFTESSAYDPRSPYAATKAASDHLVSAWSATYGLPVILTHSSNNYGPYQFPEKLIPLVILEGHCSPDSLRELDGSTRSLIISDCEGYERELFSEEVCQYLSGHDLLIECHDFVEIDTTACLIERLEGTHDLKIVRSVDDIIKAYDYEYPELANFDLQGRRSLLAEKRPHTMQWIFAKSRYPS